MTGPGLPSSEVAVSAPAPVTRKPHKKGIFMTAITSRRLSESTDSLLRFAMRADAVLTGLAGIAGIPVAGWLADTSGTTVAFEYGMAAFFIAYGVVVFGLAALSSVKRPGMVVVIANLLYTVAAIVFVLAGVFPLTTTGVVLTLASGVYTAVFAELQYQGWRRIKA
jgi:CHASE2 domain-containing sensor protein